ncbi:MAG: helix-turn-helix transcriptional regulator [Flavobacteriales bacterium]|jgi:predicted DNA-binding transcriptional regulator YafY
MATNKHAVIRYHALDKCFANYSRRYFIDDLVSACNDALYEYTGVEDGVKKRQVFEDIKFMESDQGWSVPLERLKDGKQVFYRYSDKHFSIKNQAVNETEAKQIKETLSILGRFKGMPHFEWMEEMNVRLEATFDISANHSSIVEFDQNQYLKGLNYFTELFHSIQNKNVLTIQYRGFKQAKQTSMIIHPYYLKQYNNRWFLFGHNEEYENISNLALDRINGIKSINKSYRENNTINFEEYFEDVVGVTVSNEAKLEKIQLEIDPHLWPYIESKPIHGSQRVISKRNDKVIIELIVQINYELVTTLFAYGDGVKVMQPHTLKEEMITKAKAIISRYS